MSQGMSNREECLPFCTLSGISLRALRLRILSRSSLSATTVIPVKNCSTLHLRSRRGAGNIINVPCGHAPVLALRVSQFQAPKRTKIIHERISSRTGFSAHLLCSDAANRKGMQQGTTER